MLPASIPLFPLPNVVLFPNVFLPLHIFEARYRTMLADALAGDRIIGMVLLKPGWEGQHEERPPVYPIGCAGLISHTERLGDGRSNIILRGLEKFRVLSEDTPLTSYRIAQVEPIAEDVTEPDRQAVRRQRGRLEMLLMPSVDRTGVDSKLPTAMSDEDLVNALAQYVELEPLERQALLEREGLVARCRGLIELLEMKVIVARGAGGWRQ